MTAPVILKSYSDSGDRAGGGAFWQVDFTTIDSYDGDEDPQLDKMAMPMQGSTMTMVFDYMGVFRKIGLQGSRTNNDLNGSSAMTNAAWLTLLRSKQQGKQSLIGPFRLVVQLENTDYLPTETVKCYIGRLKWRYRTKGVNVLEYDVDLYVGGAQF